MIDNQILQELGSPLEEVRSGAIMKLIRTGEATGLPILEGISAGDPSLKLRHLARVGIAALQKASSMSGFHNVTSFDSFTGLGLFEKVRFLETAAKSKDPRWSGMIEQIVKRESVPYVAARAIRTIGLMGDRKSIPFLGSLVANPDSRLAKAAIQALGLIGHPGSILYLPNISNPDNEVIREAVDELREKLTDKTISEYMSGISKSPSVPTRVALCRYLEKFGSDSAGTILDTLLSDPEKHVSAAASAAKTALMKRSAAAPAQETDFSISIDLDSDAVDSSDGALVARLYSEDPKVRIMVLREIHQEGLATRHEDRLMAMAAEEQDPYVLATLMKVLGSLRSDGSTRVLLGFLNNSDPRIRTNAIEGLMAMPVERYAARVEPLLDDGNNRVRSTACIALKNHCPDRVTKVLEAMAGKGSEAEKVSAIYAIQDIARDEVITILPGLCGDASQNVRERAFNSLSILSGQGNPTARAILSLEFGGDDEDETLSLAVAMKELGLSFNELCAGISRDGVELDSVVFALDSPNEAERLNALRVLDNIGDSRALESVQRATRDHSVKVRQQAATTFVAIKRRLRGASGSGAAFHELVDGPGLASTLETGVREERITALKKVNVYDTHVLPILIAHVKREKDPFVKPILATVIGMIGDSGAIPYLLPYLAEEDPRIRANSVEALEYLNDSSAFPYIIALMEDDNKRVRENVVKALKNLGGDGVKKIMAETSHAPDPWIRAATMKALGNIVSSWTAELILESIRTESNPHVLGMTLKSFGKAYRNGKIKETSALTARMSAGGTGIPSKISEDLVEWYLREGLTGGSIEDWLAKTGVPVPENPLTSGKTSAAFPEESASGGNRDGQISSPGTMRSRAAEVNEEIDPFAGLPSESGAESGFAQADPQLEEEGLGSLIIGAGRKKAGKSSERQGTSQGSAKGSTADEHFESLLERIAHGDPDSKKNAINAVLHAGKAEPRVREVLREALRDSDLVVKFFAKKALDELFEAPDRGKEHDHRGDSLRPDAESESRGSASQQDGSAQAVIKDIAERYTSSKSGSDADETHRPPDRRREGADSSTSSERKAGAASSEAGESGREEIARLSELLAAPGETARAKAVQDIMKSKNPALLAPLRKAISRESDPVILTMMLQTLMSFGGDEEAEVVSSYLGHKDGGVRASAVELLISHDIAGYYDKIISLVDDPVPTVSEGVIDVITMFDGQTAKNHLTALTGSSEASDRKLAAKCLELVEKEWAMTLIEELRQDPDSEVRLIASNTLDLDDL